MRRKSSLKGPTLGSFNLPLSIVAFFSGVIMTFLVTRVWAQTADTNQIYACVNNTNGSVRIVTSSETCKQHEKSVKWSIQGPPGPQGPAGQTGGLNQYFGLPFICNSCFLSPLADRFIDKDFSYAQITRSDFSNADFSRVKFEHAFLSNNNFTNSNLSNANFSNQTELSGGRVSQNNTFMGANVTSANFSNSVLQDSSFVNANLQNTNFSNTTLRRVKFSGAQNYSTADFSGAIFEDVTCPDGFLSSTSCDGHF